MGGNTVPQSRTTDPTIPRSHTTHHSTPLPRSQARFAQSRSADNPVPTIPSSDTTFHIQGRTPVPHSQGGHNPHVIHAYPRANQFPTMVGTSPTVPRFGHHPPSSTLPQVRNRSTIPADQPSSHSPKFGTSSHTSHAGPTIPQTQGRTPLHPSSPTTTHPYTHPYR